MVITARLHASRSKPRGLYRIHFRSFDYHSTLVASCWCQMQWPLWRRKLAADTYSEFAERQVTAIVKNRDGVEMPRLLICVADNADKDEGYVLFLTFILTFG